MKHFMLALTTAGCLFASQPFAWSHCEIPCGIYDDQARINLILEHTHTIEKSMKAINAQANPNQLVRWVSNKEKHAEKIQNIVAKYFLCQRIKPVSPNKKNDFVKYQQELTWLHHILVHAMKAKQTTDPKHTQIIRDLVNQFQKSYFKKKQ